MKSDVAKALGIESDKEGWLVEIQVDDEQAWEVVQKGYITGLSLGGVQQFVTGEQEALRLREDPKASAEDVRLVTSLAIKELSLVLAPANPLSTVEMTLEKGKEVDMTTAEQLDRIKELESQVSKMQSEKQELELKLSALQEPPVPVTIETLLEKGGLPQESVVLVEALAAKAKEAEEKLEKFEQEAAKSAVVSEIAYLELGDASDAMALALLQAGNGRQVILEAFKGLHGRLEATAIALGAKPKVSKGEADKEPSVLDALVEENKKRGLK